jgi:hypothetical protein
MTVSTCLANIREAAARVIKDLEAADKAVCALGASEVKGFQEERTRSWVHVVSTELSNKADLTLKSPPNDEECLPCLKVLKGPPSVTPVSQHLVGCSTRKTKKTLPSPQKNEYITDKKWVDKVWTRCPKDSTICMCTLCDRIDKGAHAIQQHCKQHFLPEYHCNDCGDSWHLKTQWQQHFSYECPVCSKTIKGEQNFKSHLKKH